MLLEFTYFIFNIHLQKKKKKKHSYITKHTLQKSTRVLGPTSLPSDTFGLGLWVVQVSKVEN